METGARAPSESCAGRRDTRAFVLFVMTALAMIVGMLPMALGVGRGRRRECSSRPGGDRGLAVLRTVATLFFRSGFLQLHPQLAPGTFIRELVLKARFIESESSVGNFVIAKTFTVLASPGGDFPARR